MKHISILVVLLTSFSSFSQIWKEPFDTLGYNDRALKVSKDMLNVKSYTVTRYSSKDSITQFDYYGFDEKGRQVSEIYEISLGELSDTTRYYYDGNGIVHRVETRGESVTYLEREYSYNKNGRLVDLATSLGDSTWHIRYVYSDKNLLDSIIYSPLRWKTFGYNNQGEVIRKDVYENGKLKEYFNYTHPNKNTLIYQNCLIDDRKGVPFLPCEVVEGYYNRRKQLVKIVSKYDLDSLNTFIVDFVYDENGNVEQMSDRGSHGSGSDVIYIRDEKDRLIKVEYQRVGGEVYV